MSKDEREWEFTAELQPDLTVTLTGAQALRRVIGYMVGKKLLVKISIFREVRSLAQNRYMHGVIVPCVKAWLRETQGIKWSSDEVYYWLNQEVLGNKPAITTIMGTEVITMTGKRFSKMTTKEFAEAVDTLLTHFGELGCNIPEPNQQNFVTDFIDD